jgi:hypothetical protein
VIAEARAEPADEVDRAGITVFRDMMLLQHGPATYRGR